MVFEGVDAIKKEPFACFSDEDSRYNTHLELYPRPNGDLYVCGCGGSDYVSSDRLREGGDCYDPENVVEDVARVEAATASLKSMSSVGDVGPTVVQACMRPCPPDVSTTLLCYYLVFGSWLPKHVSKQARCSSANFLYFSVFSVVVFLYDL